MGDGPRAGSDRVVADVVSRRQAIRRLIGLTSTSAALCCGLAACGWREQVATADLPDPGSAATTARGGIRQPATVQRQAVRGESIQATAVPPPPTRGWNPGDLVFSGNRGGPPVVAFTYDDGPWPMYTQGVMNHFRDKGLEGKATFFWVANNVRTNPGVAREVVDRGYAIANHSLTHATYSPRSIAREIGPAQDLIERMVGIRPKLFRSPGLTRGDVIQSTLAAHGMCNVFTSTDLGDWTSPRVSASRLVQRLHATIHAGHIILLHDGGSHRPTVDATPAMIDVARDKGLQIVPLEELLANGNLERIRWAIERTQQQITEEYRADELVAQLPQDDFDWVVELTTVLEEATSLTAEQRALIEAELALHTANRP